MSDQEGDFAGLPEDVARHLNSIMQQDAEAERKRLRKLQGKSRGFRCSIQ